MILPGREEQKERKGNNRVLVLHRSSLPWLFGTKSLHGGGIYIPLVSTEEGSKCRIRTASSAGDAASAGDGDRRASLKISSPGSLSAVGTFSSTSPSGIWMEPGRAGASLRQRICPALPRSATGRIPAGGPCTTAHSCDGPRTARRGAGFMIANRRSARNSPPGPGRTMSFTEIARPARRRLPEFPSGASL
jgi:hypothetical protein